MCLPIVIVDVSDIVYILTRNSTFTLKYPNYKMPIVRIYPVNGEPLDVCVDKQEDIEAAIGLRHKGSTTPSWSVKSTISDFEFELAQGTFMRLALEIIMCECESFTPVRDESTKTQSAVIFSEESLKCFQSSIEAVAVALSLTVTTNSDKETKFQNDGLISYDRVVSHEVLDIYMKTRAEIIRQQCTLESSDHDSWDIQSIHDWVTPKLDVLNVINILKSMQMGE